MLVLKNELREVRLEVLVLPNEKAKTVLEKGKQTFLINTIY